jgi:hypothetical protein
MSQRPISVTVIGGLFIASGCIALFSGLLPLAQHIDELKQHPFESGLVDLVRILGVTGGLFTLCGFNWARWLIVGWLTYHVILSGFHSPAELLIHALLAVVVTYFLFRAPTGNYFRAARVEASIGPKKDEDQAA